MVDANHAFIEKQHVVREPVPKVATTVVLLQMVMLEEAKVEVKDDLKVAAFNRPQDAFILTTQRLPSAPIAQKNFRKEATAMPRVHNAMMATNHHPPAMHHAIALMHSRKSAPNPAHLAMVALKHQLQVLQAKELSLAIERRRTLAVKEIHLTIADRANRQALLVKEQEATSFGELSLSQVL